MALDQAGHHRLTRQIERRHGIVPLRQNLIRGADCGYAPITDRDRAIGDQVQLSLLSSPAWRAMIDHAGQLSGVQEVEIAHDWTAGVVTGSSAPSAAAALSPA